MLYIVYGGLIKLFTLTFFCLSLIIKVPSKFLSLELQITFILAHCTLLILADDKPHCRSLHLHSDLK